MASFYGASRTGAFRDKRNRRLSFLEHKELLWLRLCRGWGCYSETWALISHIRLPGSLRASHNILDAWIFTHSSTRLCRILLRWGLRAGQSSSFTLKTETLPIDMDLCSFCYVSPVPVIGEWLIGIFSADTEVAVAIGTVNSYLWSLLMKELRVHSVFASGVSFLQTRHRCSSSSIRTSQRTLSVVIFSSQAGIHLLPLHFFQFWTDSRPLNYFYFSYELISMRCDTSSRNWNKSSCLWWRVTVAWMTEDPSSTY